MQWGRSFRGLALMLRVGSLRDPGSTAHPSRGPHAVLTPGRTELGEGTELEEDNGIRGFVLWIQGQGEGWTEPHTPFFPSLSLLPPCAGIEMGASFLMEGMGEMSAGQASTGQGGWGWQLNQSEGQGMGRNLGGGAGPHHQKASPVPGPLLSATNRERETDRSSEYI